MSADKTRTVTRLWSALPWSGPRRASTYGSLPVAYAVMKQASHTVHCITPKSEYHMLWNIRDAFNVQRHRNHKKTCQHISMSACQHQHVSIHRKESRVSEHCPRTIDDFLEIASVFRIKNRKTTIHRHRTVGFFVVLNFLVPHPHLYL